MRKLFRIANDVDGFDTVVNHVDREYGVRAAVQIGNDTRFTIDHGDAPGQVVWHKSFHAADDGARHILWATNEVRDSRRLAAAIGMEHRVARQQCD